MKVGIKSFDILDIDISEQHSGAGPWRYESWLIVLADIWLLGCFLSSFIFMIYFRIFIKILFFIIMNDFIILLLYSFDCLIFTMVWSDIWHWLLCNNLIFFILPIQLYFEIVLLGINLICQFCLFDYVSNKFEIIEEKHELPQKPNYDQEKSYRTECYHSSTVQ